MLVSFLRGLAMCMQNCYMSCLSQCIAKHIVEIVIVIGAIFFTITCEKHNTETQVVVM